MQNEKVTIITVTYNAGNLLERTILSVINQTYTNIEYIIIDGGSTDNTVDIIKQYEDKISYWISEPDKGIYFAMNKGIQKATGEWINFMNAGDTFVSRTTIQNVMDNVNKNTELIYGNHVCDGTIGSVKDRKITQLMPCCHQSLFVKTILMKQNLYNTFYQISADYDFILKMYQSGKKFQYIEEPIANYLREGFSDQNQIRWHLETLTLLMNHNIDLDEIINSPAYQILTNNKIQMKFASLQHKYNVDIDIADKKLTSLQHKYNIDLDIANKKLANLQHKYNIDLDIAEKRFVNLKNKFDLLIETLSNISNTKTFKNPFKKIKAYKKLISLYHKL